MRRREGAARGVGHGAALPLRRGTLVNPLLTSIS